MSGHNVSSVLCTGAGLEQANRECGRHGKDATRRLRLPAAVHLSHNATHTTIQ